MLNNGAAGFVIPEYQRQYDWSESHIERLYYDSLNGLQRLADSNKSDDSSAFTFLGTLILVKNRDREPDFTGESLEVVDGQQRLTTLAIFSCALCESIRKEKANIDFNLVDKDVSTWLDDEAGHRLLELYRFVIGSQLVRPNEGFPFSRIVRKGDSRGRTPANSEYISPVGKLFFKFSEYFNSEQDEWELPDLGEGTAGEKLKNNYKKIKVFIENINDVEFYGDTECDLFNINSIKKARCRELLERLVVLGDESKKNRALDYVVKNKELHSYIRLLTFAAYFTNFIILTRVTVEEESAAFDIFDALNTTGEPLTALETLKPNVIKFENESKPHKSFIGSESEESFRVISECLDERFKETSRKQLETKELVVTFALYIAGEKLSKDLASQRRFLRSNYEKSKSFDNKCPRMYVDSLAKIAKFRRYYWDGEGIKKLNKFHNSNIVQEIQLLATFLNDMNTSLALPILARYWNFDRPSFEEREFLDVIRAIVSFLVIRRAATGGTATIDSDFRSVMEEVGASRSKAPKFGLCVGVRHTNSLLSLAELKNAFRTLLLLKLKSLNKERWIESVISNPLYSQSRTLVRFMILAAAHNALGSEEEPGLWTKKGVRTSESERNFLSYETWLHSNYKTVEHIAPENPAANGWQEKFYYDDRLKNSIGNLVLLPAKENSAFSNHSWLKKRTLYKALAEHTEVAQKSVIEEARKENLHIADSTSKLFQRSARLALLEPLSSVEEWTEDIVLKRGRNIAALTWDVLRPWLDE